MLIFAMIVLGQISNLKIGVEGKMLNSRRNLEAPSTAANTCTHATQYDVDAATVALCKTFTTQDECQKPRYYCPTAGGNDCKLASDGITLFVTYPGSKMSLTENSLTS